MLGSRGVAAPDLHESEVTLAESLGLMLYRSAKLLFALSGPESEVPCAQVRLFMSGAETVLTDAANPEELFATADFETRWGLLKPPILQRQAAAVRQLCLACDCVIWMQMQHKGNPWRDLFCLLTCSPLL